MGTKAGSASIALPSLKRYAHRTMLRVIPRTLSCKPFHSLSLPNASHDGKASCRGAKSGICSCKLLPIKAACCEAPLTSLCGDLHAGILLPWTSKAANLLA